MQMPPQSLSQHEIIELPTRRSGPHTSTFAPIEITSNHYHVQIKNIEQIVIFSVKFTPLIPHDNSKLRNYLINNLMPQIGNKIHHPIHSGMNIYSIQQAEQSEQEYQSGEYTIKIKKVKVYRVKQNPKLLLTFLNNSLRNIMRKLNYVEIGKTSKFFNSQDKKEIDNLMMYSGFKSNFTFLQKGPFLRVDSVKKIVRNQTVLNYIDNLIKIHRDKEKEQRRNYIKADLIGKVVMANYGKTMYYTIGDVIFDELDSILIDKTTTTLRSFYQQKYKISIANPHQPLLVAETKQKKQSQQRILLIPELMLMTGIPDDFDEIRRKKISESTIKPPAAKLEEISGLMKKLKDTQDLQTLKNLGICINNQMQRMKAKIIPTPMLQLGNKNKVEKGKQAFFNLFNKPIFSSKHEVSCAIIYFKGTDITVLTETFQKTSANLSLQLKIQKHEIPLRPSIQAIQAQMSSAIQNAIIFAVQYFLVIESTLRKKNVQSIVTKILIQIAAKRGNILWVPKPTCEIKNTMIVGFDQAKLGKSYVLSICATINSTFSSVFSSTIIYEGNQIKYEKMVDLLMLATNSYMTRNTKCPAEVIIFMNSCTGDQISLYHNFFVKPYNQKIRLADENCNIALSLIMVNVKTSERFFYNSQNVKAGTLINEGLVSPNYDFYIVSQQSNRGTSVPNHYKVIYNTSELQEGMLQQLTFSQCFNYVNWTGSIKVPAILQYAKKCCRFGAQVLEQNEVPDCLWTRLYFI